MRLLKCNDVHSGRLNLGLELACPSLPFIYTGTQRSCFLCAMRSLGADRIFLAQQLRNSPTKLLLGRIDFGILQSQHSILYFNDGWLWGLL